MEETEVNQNLEDTRTWLEIKMSELGSNLDNNRIYLGGVLDTLWEMGRINSEERDILQLEYGN
jgi:hypothetical protein